jgi:hypothetical protein
MQLVPLHPGGVFAHGARASHGQVLHRRGQGWHFSLHVIIVRQNTVQLMTASMFHVTNLTPGSECNPSRAYGQTTHQLMIASMVHVTNRVTPGSECDPGRGQRRALGTAWRHVQRLAQSRGGGPGGHAEGGGRCARWSCATCIQLTHSLN